MSISLTQPHQGHQDYQILMGVIGTLKGLSKWSAPIDHIAFDSDSRYAHVLQNQGTGGALHIKASGGSTLLTAADSGVTIPTLAVTTLTATTANITTANITTSNETTANVGTLNVTSAANLGNGDGDTITVIGLSTFRNAANTATQLYVDAGNNRVIVGSATALGSATNDKMTVSGGRLYVAPNSEEIALGLRYSTTSGQFHLGATNAADPALLLKDAGGDEVVRVNPTGSTYALDVNTPSPRSTNAARFTGDVLITTDLGVRSIAATGTLTGVTKIAIDTSSFSGSEKLRVTGASRMEGAVEITTGGLSVTGGAIVNSSVSITGSGTPFLLLGSSQTASTVGAAGGASALPATPSGYIKVTIGATDYKIPYYAA